MRPPKLNAIRMFEAAGRNLNFRLAAEELNLTQGAVAQSVRGLEADLGITLFQRMARGLALTDAGKTYYSEIARGLSIIDRATDALQPASNAVAISVPPSFASKWLVPRLPKYSEAHPDVEVRIFATETVTDFATQDVDVAVRQGKRPINAAWEVNLLAPLDLCAFCSPKAKFSTSRVDSLKELSHLPLIQDSHRYWERLLTEARAKVPDQFLKFNQTALALDAAANGQGITIAPLLIGMMDVELKRLKELWRDKRSTDCGLWLVYPRAEVANHTARTSLVDWLIGECNHQGKKH